MVRCDICKIETPADRIRVIDSGERLCFDCLAAMGNKSQETSYPPPTKSTIPTKANAMASRKECSSCKEWINVEAVKCPYCRTRTPQKSTKPDPVIEVISVLIPLVGFIVGTIFSVKDDPTDRHIGHSYLLCAVIGAILGLLLWLMLFMNLIDF